MREISEGDRERERRYEGNIRGRQRDRGDMREISEGDRDRER